MVGWRTWEGASGWGTERLGRASYLNVGEHETCIHHDVSVLGANQHTVHSDLSQSTDREDAQGGALVRRGAGEGTTRLDNVQGRAQVLSTVRLAEDALRLAPRSSPLACGCRGG